MNAIRYSDDALAFEIAFKKVAVPANSMKLISRRTMLSPQSYVPSQPFSGYRPEQRRETVGQHSVDNRPELESPADIGEALDTAYAEIDRQFENGAPTAAVHECVKVLVGVKSDGPDTPLTKAALVLSGRAEPMSEFSGSITPGSVMLLIKLYADVVRVGNAFEGDCDPYPLNFQNFVKFVAGPLNMRLDDVVEALPIEPSEVVLTDTERTPVESEPEVRERKVMVGETELWLRVVAESRLEALPLEITMSIVTRLGSLRDRASLAVTSSAMHETLKEHLVFERVTEVVKTFESPDDVSWVLGADEDSGQGSGLICELQKSRDKAEMLSIVAGRGIFEQFSSPDREKVFDRMLVLTLKLNDAHVSGPLAALIKILEIPDDRRATKFSELVDLASTLSMDKSARLLSALAGSDLFGLLSGSDRTTMFGRLLAGVKELRHRNRYQLPDVLAKDLGRAASAMDDPERQLAMDSIFEMIKESPEHAHSQAFLELTRGFMSTGADGGARTNVKLDLLLNTIGKLRKRDQAKPLAALATGLAEGSNRPEQARHSVSKIFDAVRVLPKLKRSAVLIYSLVLLLHAKRKVIAEKTFDLRFAHLLGFIHDALTDHAASLNDFPGHLLGELYLTTHDARGVTHKNLLDRVRLFPIEVGARVMKEMLEFSPCIPENVLDHYLPSTLNYIVQLPADCRMPVFAALTRRMAELTYWVDPRIIYRSYSVIASNMARNVTVPLLKVADSLPKEKISGELFAAMVELRVAQTNPDAGLVKWLAMAAESLGQDSDRLAGLPLDRVGKAFCKLRAEQQAGQLEKLIEIFIPLSDDCMARMLAEVLKSPNLLNTGHAYVTAFTTIWKLSPGHRAGLFEALNSGFSRLSSNTRETVFVEEVVLQLLDRVKKGGELSHELVDAIIRFGPDMARLVRDELVHDRREDFVHYLLVYINRQLEGEFTAVLSLMRYLQQQVLRLPLDCREQESKMLREIISQQSDEVQAALVGLEGNDMEADLTEAFAEVFRSVPSEAPSRST